MFQQTSTLTIDVPKSDTHVAMRTLDNVCEFLKLVGSDQSWAKNFSHLLEIVPASSRLSLGGVSASFG